MNLTNLTEIEKKEIISKLTDSLISDDPKNWYDLIVTMISKQAIVLEKQKKRNAECEQALIHSLGFIQKEDMPENIAKMSANFVVRYLQDYCAGEMTPYYTVKTFLNGIEERTMSEEEKKAFYDKQK